MKTFEQFINKKEIDFKFGNVYLTYDNSYFVYITKDLKDLKTSGIEFNFDIDIITFHHRSEQKMIGTEDLNLTINEFLLLNLEFAPKFIDFLKKFTPKDKFYIFTNKLYTQIINDKNLMNEINDYLDLNQIGLL